LKSSYPCFSKEKRIVLLPCGVPHYFFHKYDHKVLSKIRKENLKAATDDLLLVYVGNTSIDFGLHVLIEACTKFMKPEERGKVRIVIIGPKSSQVSACQKVAQKYGVSVSTLGQIPHYEMPKILQACDVGLFLPPPHAPYAWQMDLPLKIAEYLTSGLDLLITRFGNVKKILASLSIPQDKIIFTSREPLEVAENLRKLINTKRAFRFESSDLLQPFMENLMLMRELDYKYQAERLLAVIFTVLKKDSPQNP